MPELVVVVVVSVSAAVVVRSLSSDENSDRATLQVIPHQH